MLPNELKVEVIEHLKLKIKYFYVKNNT